MANGGAISKPIPGALDGLFAAIALFLKDLATLFAPMNLFRLSFVIAAALCIIYSISLPTEFYVATGRVLLSDASIYYFMSAIGMFLTERALKEFDNRTRQHQ